MSNPIGRAPKHALSQIIRKRGLTVTAVAAQLGIPRERLTRIGATGECPLEIAVQLCQLLNVSAAELGVSRSLTTADVELQAVQERYAPLEQALERLAQKPSAAIVNVPIGGLTLGNVQLLVFANRDAAPADALLLLRALTNLYRHHRLRVDAPVSKTQPAE